MKINTLIILLFCSLAGSAQTIRVLSGFDPVTMRPGYIYRDTSITLNDSRIVFSKNGSLGDTSTLVYKRSKGTVGIGGAADDTALLKVNGDMIVDNGIRIHNGLDNRADNIAIGFQTLYHNASNGYSVAVGYRALEVNTTGEDLLAVGAVALQKNTTGIRNTGVGAGALNGNTTGQHNTATGAYAAYTNTTGSYNTALGEGSLRFNTTGSNNMAIGSESLLTNTTGSGNIGIGTNSASSVTTGVNNTIIGYGARPNTTSGNGSYNTIVGFASGNNSFGDSSVYIGANAGYNNIINSMLFVDNGSSPNLPLLHGKFSPNLSVQTLNVNGKLGVNIINLDASAAFQILSTTGGVGLPTMTATQASAIGTPMDGLLLYVTSTNGTFTAIGVWARENGIWVKL